MSDAFWPNGAISLHDAVQALLQAMAVWDEDSLGHSERTADYAAAICSELGITGSDADLIRIGALLHDIGKMGVDLTVLKKPGALESHETEGVHLHPEMGAEILARVLPPVVVECTAFHHEQPDGGGYPHGLTEPDIPVGALICRVADVLDSLTSDQSYRPRMSLEESLAELRNGAGTLYSERVVAALLRVIERGELGLEAA